MRCVLVSMMFGLVEEGEGYAKSNSRMLQNRGLGLRVVKGKTFMTFKFRTCSGGSKIVAQAYKSAL